MHRNILQNHLKLFFLYEILRSEHLPGQTSTEGDAMKDNNYTARNDSYNWNNVLNNAVKQNPNLSLFASIGDQVN